MGLYNVTLLFPLIAQSVIAIFMGLFFGSIPVALTTIFPVSVRFSGISLAHNVSMAIFGGTAPLVATFLINYTGSIASPAFMLIIAAALSLCWVLRLGSAYDIEGHKLAAVAVRP
jgi:MHS family proline/betaine transporter-like MFS transporter